MCYLEDVYYSQCGHWAEKPRLYCRRPSEPQQLRGQVYTYPSLPKLEQQMDFVCVYNGLQQAESEIQMSKHCRHPKTFGSAADYENRCPRCTQLDVSHRIVLHQTGMSLIQPSQSLRKCERWRSRLTAELQGNGCAQRWSASLLLYTASSTKADRIADYIGRRLRQDSGCGSEMFDTDTDFTA